MKQNFVLTRVVFPSQERIKATIDSLPIYLECEVAQIHKYASYMKSRTRMQIPKGEAISFCSYYNAFPASYWKQNTDLEEVIFQVEIEGEADIKIMASDAYNIHKKIACVKKVTGKFEQPIPLQNFQEGGWIWFEVSTPNSKAAIDNAVWAASLENKYAGASASITITTLNKQEYCLKQLKNMSAHLDELVNIDKIYFVDQGSQNLAEYPGISEEIAKFQNRVQIIKQGNFGGSGGFSRGMYETLKAEESDFVFMIDDDTFLETESIQRSINFATLCQQPTIVGGHMLIMNEPACLHAFAEFVNKDVFKWGPVPGTQKEHDFSTRLNFLSNTEWLHKNHQAEYNGWWMCLVPVSVIREIGLSVPMFIKCDDSEFGMRAKEFGYKTISLPGSAVWHESWKGKDDAIDWTSFYHWRNRFIVALYYLDQKRAPKFLLDTYIWTLSMIACMRYSVGQLHFEAIESLYNNPEDLIDDLPIRMERIAETRSRFEETKTKDISEFPHPRYKTDNTKRKVGAITAISSLFFGFLHQLTPEKHDPDGRPDHYIAPQRGYWWRLPNLDSALVATNSSNQVSLYKRDRAQFFALAFRITKLYLKIFKDWGRLHKKYLAARLEMCSIQKWRKLFEEN